MPSPAGHVVAGLAIAWGIEAASALRVEPRPAGTVSAPAAPRALTPLALACAALALAPDLDILLATHRTFTHSVGAVAAAAAAGAAIARALGARGAASGLTCGLAVASHIVLDWLGRDGTPPLGLMALWPLSSAFYYSGIDVFADVSRRYWNPNEFILGNAVSVARELAILGPLAAGAFWFRHRRFTQVSGSQRGSGTVEPRIPDPESRPQ